MKLKLFKPFFLLASDSFAEKDDIDQSESDLYLEVTQELPKQFPSEEQAQVVQAMSSLASNGMAASVIVPFTIQFGLKSILGKTWPLLN